MTRLVQMLRHRRDITCMTIAFLLLVAAITIHPKINYKQEVRSYFLIIDISQSMNVEDLEWDGNSVSRLIYTRHLIGDVISNLPCGTYVSVGLFAGSGVAALYTPLEVCSNFSSIQDTVSHADWRNAWAANSRIRESLTSLATVLRGFPEPAQPVYFTDGEEAPKLHVFNTKDLTNFQGGTDWLFVGIGSEKGAPIPKYTDQNQLIGYWSNDSFAMQPGISQISEGNLGARDTSVSTGAYDRYISKLDYKYLNDLARQINGHYVKGDSTSHVLEAMKSLKPSRYSSAPLDVSWVFAAAAGLFFLGAFLPKHPVALLKISITSGFRRVRIFTTQRKTERK